MTSGSRKYRVELVERCTYVCEVMAGSSAEAARLGEEIRNSMVVPSSMVGRVHHRRAIGLVVLSEDLR